MLTYEPYVCNGIDNCLRSYGSVLNLKPSEDVAALTVDEQL